MLKDYLCYSVGILVVYADMLKVKVNMQTC